MYNDENIIPVMDKNTVKVITQTITPEEAKYVRDIKSTLDDTKKKKKTADDIIYLTKIMSFYEKLKVLEWNSDNQSCKTTLNDFKWRLESYRDAISEQIQSIIGEIKGADITKLELPVSDNPLEIINEIKICVQNWYNLHVDNNEYIGARHLTSDFLSQVHKYVYLLRLCKVSTSDYCRPDETYCENCYECLFCVQNCKAKFTKMP